MKKDMKLARQKTQELRLRQGLICPELAFSEPASLSLLQRKSIRDSRDPSEQREKVPESALLVADIKNEKERRYLLVLS